MDVTVTYNVPMQETLGVAIAVYFLLTGLSSGSFIVSSLGYTTGRAEYKPVAGAGLLLALLFLAAAPAGLLAHSGQPLRSWHLFVFVNPSSPLSWGAYLLSLLPVAMLCYGYCLLKGDERGARIFGIAGAGLALSLDLYKGFVLAVSKARALWSTPVMPPLFVVSGLLSGIAVIMLVVTLKGIWCDKDRKPDAGLQSSLAVFMIWVIAVDLALAACDLIVHLTGSSEHIEAGRHMLTGLSGCLFLGGEVTVGKIVPLVLLAVPKWRRNWVYILAALLVLAGVALMRYNVVVGGEHIPIV